MPDEPDPPRKFYQLKPREFENVNAVPRTDAAAPPPAPDPGIVAADAARIDVRDLARTAAGGGAALGNNAVVNRPNEVHTVLHENYERDKAAGSYRITLLEDKKRRRRVRLYWGLLVAVDVPLGLFAWKIGPGAAIPFVCAIAGVGMFTAWWTWETWFLRTD